MAQNFFCQYIYTTFSTFFQVFLTIFKYIGCMLLVCYAVKITRFFDTIIQSLSFILSTIIVFFRYTQYLYGVLLTALNYLTPIFYPVNILPDWLKEIMVFNPMYNFIEMFRNIMIYGRWPEVTEHCICILFAVGTLMLGIYIFKKKQNNFILYI